MESLIKYLSLALYYLLNKEWYIDAYRQIVNEEKTGFMGIKRMVTEQIDWAATKSLFYGSIKSSTLSDFNLLTKQLITNKGGELLTGSGDNIRKNSSGGSTGQPLLLWQDSEYRKWCNATEHYYFREMLGVDYYRARKVLLWGSDRDALKQQDRLGKIFNWMTNTVFLNTFNVSEEGWMKYVETINQVKPVFIKGYAGSLYQMAKYIKKRKLHIYQPQFLYSSAETLQDFMRKEIEEVFGVKVYDFYGSREVGPIAGECKYGNKHIFLFNNLVEVWDLTEDKQIVDNKEGRLVVTNLHNKVMPLIRYEIGDVGRISNRKCKCGNQLPYFEELKGRITDYFKAVDGTLVHGEFFTHLFYYRNWVDKFQVNQLKKNLIEVRIVKNGKRIKVKEKKEIIEKMKKVMGADCLIGWKYVKEIPSTAQGKFLFTRCLV